MDIINECQASGDKNPDAKYFDSYENLEVSFVNTNIVTEESYN